MLKIIESESFLEIIPHGLRRRIFVWVYENNLVQEKYLN